MRTFRQGSGQSMRGQSKVANSHPSRYLPCKQFGGCSAGTAEGNRNGPQDARSRACRPCSGPVVRLARHGDRPLGIGRGGHYVGPEFELAMERPGVLHVPRRGRHVDYLHLGVLLLERCGQRHYHRARRQRTGGQDHPDGSLRGGLLLAVALVGRNERSGAGRRPRSVPNPHRRHQFRRRVHPRDGA